MASSIVDKYEQILAADPRSRIFVELAKALVERGEHARAVEVCRRGLEFHPGSILGRVVWGRALLEGGDTKGALDQFDIAIGLEPASPYAYNHVGEALLAKGLNREALPVLARAVELQPADARVRGWLDQAKQRVTGEFPAVPAQSQSSLSLEDDFEEQTEPYRPIARRGGRASTRTASGSDITAVQGSGPASATQREDTTPFPAPTLPAAGDATPDAAAPAADAAPSPSDPVAAPPAASAAPPAASAVPPPVPPPVPPAASSGPPARKSVLYMLPDDGAREVVTPSLASRLNIPAVDLPPPPAAAPADPAEVERAAAEYERALREKLSAAPEPPPSFVHRHRRLVIGGTLAIAIGAAAGVYAFVSARNAAVQAAGAAARARAGLARDTLASLREAQRLLGEARTRSADPEIGALTAEIDAILATEHGDEAAGAAARALVESGAAGDAAPAVAWLLAQEKDARAAAESALLETRPSGGALLQALAGRILVGRGELEAGRGRLELAARANPPLLRALSDLGDLALAAGDPEGALAYHGAALAAHPTHPRSAIGAAEARLALGRDLQVSRKELDAVDADAGSAPPSEVRLRFEIARARVLAALGEPGPAATRLARVAGGEDDSRLAAALAELHLQARAFGQAEATAARAVARAPGDANLRVLLARARIGRGRFAAALEATEGADGRAVRIQRAIARYRLGQWAEARAELEKTGRDGKLPADAAVWYGLVDVASGHAARALPLLEKLAEAKSPAPLAHLARGRALEALGRTAEAERAYRAAAEREPLAAEGPAALGRLLLASGRAKDAVAPLERAVKLDPSDLATRRALGEARLAAGQPSAARGDLDLVLLAAPKDTAALRILSAAWLAEGQPREARLAADRAVGLAPKDPAALLAAARAAHASGDASGAKKLGRLALKAGAKGAEAVEARRLVAGLSPRKS